jgi:hypothetical protein
MGIGLLAPLFLAGLLTITVPILVHLVHRERKQPLAFPSLMFLRRVPFRSARRQRIRYWLLFLLRTAALLLIAAAFARPWLKSPTAPVRNARGGKDIVVMVDRSYSMSARGVWERAQRAATGAVGSAAANDRVALIAFGEQAALHARLDEPRSRAQLAARNLERGSDVTRYAPAFKLASSVLANARGPAEIILITDRQRNGWRNVEQASVPPQTTVRVVDVHTDNVRNVAITDVRLAESTFAGRQRLVPTARLVNRGADPVSTSVELRFSGRVQQARTVAVPAHGVAAVTFDPLFANAAAGEIRIASDDDIAADNVAYFTSSGTAVPAVRVVSGNGDALYYFENALAAGDAGAFAVQRASARLNTADLQKTDVVVFLEVQLPTGEQQRQLAEFVLQGGGLIVVAGAGRRTDDALLPVRDIATVERPDNPTTLVSIDAAHPIFSPYRAIGAEQFASARISQFARAAVKAGATVVARFADGAPALVEQRIGRGRVIYYGSGFSRRAGDLVLQPAFVPFAQQLVAHAAASGRTPRSFTVGNVIDVNAFAPADADAVVLTPGRTRVRIPPASGARTMRIDEPGVYQIRGVGAGAVTQVVAANVDISESDLATIEPAIFNDAITPRERVAAPALAQLRPVEREQQQSLWWYLLLVAFVLLASETLIGNRISSAWRT